MTKKLKAETVTADPATALRLWFGLLGPPMFWAVQFQTVYLASEWACYARDFRWIHVASIFALILALSGVGVAFTEWRRSGGGTKDESSDPNTRRRFMAIIGILFGLLSLALIIATWLPTLTGVPCGT